MFSPNQHLRRFHTYTIISVNTYICQTTCAGKVAKRDQKFGKNAAHHAYLPKASAKKKKHLKPITNNCYFLFLINMY